MMADIAVLIAALAFAVLVGYLITTLVQIRKTAARTEELLTRLNEELPLLLKEVRSATENVNALAEDARDGVEHAAVFLHAVGGLGDTVQHVRGLVEGRGLIGNLTGVVAGIKAATAVIKDRFRKEGGNPNGRQ
jgi:uncharacterized protein YoxC